MADANTEADTKETFRRSSMSRIASSDELDHYIKVTNPSAWVVIAAGLLLVVGVLVWALVAIVPVKVDTTGILTANQTSSKSIVICIVDKPTADKIRESGAKATVGNVEAESVAVNNTPVSAAEMSSFLGSDFYAEALDLSDWNYIVTIMFDEVPEHSDYTIGTKIGEVNLVPVSIIVAETRPLNLVLGKE